ncbi:MAG TPA: GtrA family protein [Candidatus Saccharimonadia bacterium]|jgi:putative flippase GtrA|nr:GtrA family protein [Candidatus Saccharimonadia bacterium]
MEKRPKVTTDSRKSASELKRVGKFAVVGIVNTVIDFGLYNILSSGAGFTLVEANIVSTTVAMVFSFFANRHIVFNNKDGSLRRQVIRFFLVTAFGLYVLQTGTIKILTDVWVTPLHGMLSLAHSAGIHGHDAVVTKNGAKIIGTVISLTWNYIMYKQLVFD